jgi:hypothetical protein
MFKNLSFTDEKFLFEWSTANLFGWIIGLGLALQIQSNVRLAHDFSFWKSMLVWLPLGLSIGVCQWLMLKRFGINLFLWLFVTALGFSVSFTILYGAYDFNFIPQGRINLGEYIGNIDIGRNIAYLLGSMGILLGGLITSGLQAILMRKIIPRPWLWVRANLLGFLPVLILPVAYFFKLIGLNAMLIVGGYFLYMIAGALLDILLVPVISIGISLHTGKLLLEQSAPNAPYEAG